MMWSSLSGNSRTTLASAIVAKASARESVSVGNAVIVGPSVRALWSRSPRAAASATRVNKKAARGGLSRLQKAASGSFPTRLLPLVFLEMALADADRLRRHFHQLVVGDELHRVFQVQLDRRHETHGFVVSGRA